MVVIKATRRIRRSVVVTASRRTGRTDPARPETAALSATVLADLAVPASTLDAVGSPSGDSLPSAISGTSILKDQDGKPLITYVGAEYCPYCAAERWALAVALSRFGTFSNLSATHSARQRRLPEHPDTVVLRFELFEPVSWTSSPSKRRPTRS